ncbi:MULTISPECIES: hypothetical protein [unclassified Dysgonomonas]|uniref:hypothetical protein n=1 Tax=unclassified Dysgonomonas TaxID=2630389 RepID=UPI0025BD753B|nr:MULTISPECIES: hypothetical protein [unclassified Dysgonomonas]MDR2004435.1 hypothetical protein [Prevotella sp.]HMM04127.1 hypothetical protein [Dysgonomonas sp.]
MERKTLNLLVIGVLCLMTLQLHGQVTIGSGEPPQDDALLDLKENSSGTATKGLLLPRVELVALNDNTPLSTHVRGMLVYNTADVDTDVFEGCYYNDGNRWIRVGAGSGSITIPDVVLANLWQASAGWSVISQEFRCYGKAVNFIVKLQRIGADINVWNTAHNSRKIAEMPAGTDKDTYKPFASATVTSQSDMNLSCLVNFPARTISTTAECEIDFDGNIYIQNVRESVGTFMNKGIIAANDIIVVSGSYFIK